jgi:hypothetical protein
MHSTVASQQESARDAMQRLKFGLARSRDDLTQAFRLVFESYYDAGLVTEKPSGIRLTPHHLMPTSEVLVAKLDDVVTSTLSMFGDGYLGLPMESMYPQQIQSLRDKGLRLAEIGCLADRRNSPIRFMDAFIQLGRLLAQVCQVRGIDALVAVMHPKHAKLYQRVMGFQQIGDLSHCPYANDRPAVALSMRFEDHRGTPLYDRYFSDPWPHKELLQYRWDQETRKHFREILERDNTIATTAGIQGYYTWAAITGQLT